MPDRVAMHRPGQGCDVSGWPKPAAPQKQGAYLPRHTASRDSDARARKRFYDSAVWQRTRAEKLQRDPLCQCCAHDGLVTLASHVDHWAPLAQGGHPTADDNLVSLCAPCHSTKTLAERNGSPYPPIVPSAPRRLVMA